MNGKAKKNAAVDSEDEEVAEVELETEDSEELE